jgi:hypothetical protein
MENDDVLIYIRDEMLTNPRIEAEFVYGICGIARHDKIVYSLLNDYMKALYNSKEQEKIQRELVNNYRNYLQASPSRKMH